jgi:hypothetical protein
MPSSGFGKPVSSPNSPSNLTKKVVPALPVPLIKICDFMVFKVIYLEMHGSCCPTIFLKGVALLKIGVAHRFRGPQVSCANCILPFCPIFFNFHSIICQISINPRFTLPESTPCVRRPKQTRSNRYYYVHLLRWSGTFG